MTPLYEIPTPLPGTLFIGPQPSFDELDGFTLFGDLAQKGLSLVVDLCDLSQQHPLEKDFVSKTGLNYLHFPIQDYNIPDDDQKAMEVVDLVAVVLQSGKGVFIHCKGGIGRSSLLACAILLKLGYQPDKATSIVGNGRGKQVPETPVQRQWIDRIYQSYFAG